MRRVYGGGPLRPASLPRPRPMSSGGGGGRGRGGLQAGPLPTYEGGDIRRAEEREGAAGDMRFRRLCLARARVGEEGAGGRVGRGQGGGVRSKQEEAVDDSRKRTINTLCLAVLPQPTNLKSAIW